MILEPGTPQETRVPLRLGTLDPLDDLVGVKQRLANLGFECGDRSREATAALDGVVRHFQSTYDLPVTGEVDDATRAKLRDVHGA